MAHATIGELASFLGRVIDLSEEGKAAICLDVVSDAIDGHVGARTVSAATLKNVALLAARRLFETPDGVRQEILGDWQASYAPTTLLSADEKRLLDWGGAGGTARKSHGSPRTPSDLWESSQTSGAVIV